MGRTGSHSGETPQVPGSFSSRPCGCLSPEPREAVADAQVPSHHTCLLISALSPSLPEGPGRRGEKGLSFSPPAPRRMTEAAGQGAEEPTHLHTPASTLCPEPGPKTNVRERSVTSPALRNPALQPKQAGPSPGTPRHPGRRPPSRLPSPGLCAPR